MTNRVRRDFTEDFRREASARLVTRARLLVSYRTYRQISVRNPLPLVFRAFGARCPRATLAPLIWRIDFDDAGSYTLRHGRGIPT